MAQTRPRAFPRAQRIRKRADFVRIQGGGRRVTARHLLVLVAAPRAAASTSTPTPTRGGAPVARADLTRLGLVASRKVGGAVARNRAKRLVREAFRRFPDLFPEQVDVVVILRAGAGSLGLADVVEQLRSLAPVLRRRAREVLAEAPQGGSGLTPAAAGARDAADLRGPRDRDEKA